MVHFVHPTGIHIIQMGLKKRRQPVLESHGPNLGMQLELSMNISIGNNFHRLGYNAYGYGYTRHLSVELHLQEHIPRKIRWVIGIGQNRAPQ